MSRTWKREPIRRNHQWRDEYDENQRFIKHVAAKAPVLCLVGVLDETVTDAKMAGDETFVRNVRYG